MLAKLLDWLWPRSCAVCRRPVDRPARHICSDCLMRLPFVPRTGLCRTCGRDAAGLDGEFLCEDCRTHPPHFDRAVCVLRFEGEARELVNAFKFRERLEVRDDFADFLEATVRAHFKADAIDCIVPMPSTLGHRWLRGYNQCEILARALARRLNRPCLPLLRRVGHPERQGGLSEERRRENVIDTFAVTRSLRRLAQKRATVLILDDIMTTGSTLSEAARTLKSAGIARVWTIALARSIRD